MSRPPKPVNPLPRGRRCSAMQCRHIRLRRRPSPQSQAELGKLIGYSGSTVSAIERGMLPPDEKFVERPESPELPAAGVLRAMWHRRGECQPAKRIRSVSLPPSAPAVGEGMAEPVGCRPLMPASSPRRRMI